MAGGADPSDLEAALKAGHQTEIMGRIHRVVGLDSFDSIEQIERVPLAELNIAFIMPLLKGKVGVRITPRPGKIQWRRPSPDEAALHEVPDLHVRYFSIYLDAQTNQVVAVKSRLEKRSPEIQEPSPEAVEKSFGPIGERYGYFPPDDPKTTFMEVLEAIRTFDSIPLIAEEIDGFYITYNERKGLTPIPAWLINVRGGFRYPTSNPVRPEDEQEEVVETRSGFLPTPTPPPRAHLRARQVGDGINRMRYIVDANTGKVRLIAAFP